MASGVRRIEAVTGAAALDHVTRQEAVLAEAAAALKAAPAELAERVTALVGERKRLERELSEARRKLATGAGGEGRGVRPARARSPASSFRPGCSRTCRPRTSSPWPTNSRSRSAAAWWPWFR